MSFSAPKRRISATLQLDGSSKVQTIRRISSPSLEPLEDMVVCPIDLNLLEDPRLLPCGHAFCCECLTKYMHQLTVIQEGGHKDVPDAEQTFACPVCRLVCAIPASKSAIAFPKAFNHLVILDFLRKNQLSSFKAPSAPPLPDGEATAGHGRGSHRKTSIQVNSQMLNYIVSDIAARERAGKMGPVDRAIILDDVDRLLQRLRGHETVDSGKIQNAVLPTAPTRPSTSPSSCSPTGSSRNLGRFYAFESKVRGGGRLSKESNTHSDLPSYSNYRDAEAMRSTMKKNATYQVLLKGKDCCLMRPGDLFQPVDMHALSAPVPPQIVRLTITADEDRSNLFLWQQKFNPQNGLFSCHFNKPESEKPPVEISAAVTVEGIGALRVQFVRFYNGLAYVSGIMPANQLATPPMNNAHLHEIGLVVCCKTPSLEDVSDDTSMMQEGHLESSSGFPIVASSCIFRRDDVGYERPSHPILFGIDIDQKTGDVYVAQPANAMICRLRADDLTLIDGTWYLNEPQLSPYFLCYAEASNQVWATCHKEDRIVILDLENDGFHHFNPAISFGISPSYIIYTSDDRIVMLDQHQSRLFWISKTHQTICVQCLDVQFTSRLKRHFLAIQPISDATTRTVLKGAGVKCTPAGGILCAHDYGCSLIYPKKQASQRTHV
ncbi:unnamed protein product [Dicrocoelium dendriticum]|nr:unnamed protein product [Dicrocoelium dendriticum]